LSRHALARPQAAARGWPREPSGSAAVKANVSCHLTKVVAEKDSPEEQEESQSFRVYARGWWHCETAPIEGLPRDRNAGAIQAFLSIVTEIEERRRDRMNIMPPKLGDIIPVLGNIGGPVCLRGESEWRILAVIHLPRHRRGIGGSGGRKMNLNNEKSRRSKPK